eukprot:4741917-Alexandrium_andersonii.AAC.1
MSASLVGSEMCIRDSSTSTFGNTGTACSAGGSLSRALTTAEISWNSRRPVSYTHLTLPTICSV